MKGKLFLLICFVLYAIALAQPLEITAPENVGFSSERLDRIKPLMQSYIDEGKLSGLATLVARHGEVVHFETYGMKNIESKDPITKDTIFRIYSMSKPVASTAAMILYEEGKFQLNDPVSKYIPEFKKLKVFAGGTADHPIVEDQVRELQIIDLFRHTSGFTYGWNPTAVDTLYGRNKVRDPRESLHDMIVKLSDIPLLFQPGTQYNYSVSIDVLGYLVQVISGMPFDQFMQERIFGPLQMNDTGFYVPKDKLDRFATLYQLRDGALVASDVPKSSSYQKPPAAPSGGGGLVSTVSDYLKFAQMILNKGEYNGTRILGRQTVEYMLTAHFPDGLEVNPGEVFGIGFGITTDPARTDILCSQGEAAWSGAANTFFWVDPREDMIYMVWTQLFPWGAYDFRNQFRVMVHSAIID